MLVYTTSTGDSPATDAVCAEHMWQKLSQGWSECVGCGKLERIEWA